LTCTDLVQCASTMIVHVTTIVVQDKAWSYAERMPRDDFISFVIEIYDYFHPCFDSFLIFCVCASQYSLPSTNCLHTFDAHILL
jgi:hypothetical protein